MSVSVVRTSLCRVLKSSHVLTRHLSATNNKFNIIKSSFPDVAIPSGSIPEHIFEQSAPYHNLVAIECCITGRKYTYNEIRTKSRNLNRSLRKKLKLQKGDVVAILLPNVPEFPIAAFGCMLAGITVTTINPIYTADEISRQLIDSNAKALITLSDLYQVVLTAFQITQRKLPILTINDTKDASTPKGAINFNEFVDNEVDMPEVDICDANEIAFMPYSSGTTGLPKGVLLSHRNIIANLAQFSAPGFNVMVEANETYQDILPAVLPMFHIYGFTATLLGSMAAGAHVVTIPKFTPEIYLKALVQYKPTVLFAVPPIVIFLYSHPVVKASYLESVRMLMCGAAPLGALDEQKFRDKIQKDVAVIQGYGLSEASPVVTMVPISQGPRPGSVGCIVPNTTVKLVNIEDPSKEIGVGDHAELYVKGPQVMKGYHNRDEETVSTFEDGWLKTGDLFYYDENKSFFVADRIKELIKVKGFQVAPAELEEIIRDHPDVADAAVIGIPHEFHGETPRAYVILKANKNSKANDINEFVSSKVAEYKRLVGGIVIVNEIPKNASGKIMRRQLKLRFDKEGI